MQHKIKLVLLISILISCKSQYLPTIGKEYVYENNNRKLSIKILDDKNLVIENIFNCNNVNDEFRKLTFKHEYYLSKNRIIIRNPRKGEFNLPYFNKSDCDFLGEKYRENIRYHFDGKTFYPNKSLYVIPNIDTLTFIKNDRMYFYKKMNNGDIGFMFKMVN